MLVHRPLLPELRRVRGPGSLQQLPEGMDGTHVATVSGQHGQTRVTSEEGRFNGGSRSRAGVAEQAGIHSEMGRREEGLCWAATGVCDGPSGRRPLASREIRPAPSFLMWCFKMGAL